MLLSSFRHTTEDSGQMASTSNAAESEMGERGLDTERRPRRVWLGYGLERKHTDETVNEVDLSVMLVD